ncbi:Carbonic anhydrase/acetyltransferase, isoleucine patch superfamily [Rubellimicrobium thermophilum DSM 16684]|uniref:Carbonic anhydrase/acetyltransferase, isoleucine patch superfamily n=1 Tax=Rubellimicrobium thermophilum DSM 16684 TaxID=1123069 RepID=S9R2H1_9RHOB|nr:gamma carbonic anhydrase family protein [Rubellimicrobium thermophilum]EPX86148.1 Carbonic anhydrase/acetyltransferase, isoleucine patch superfamily [Rubellimicrobium thermophilum DSM 16684]
MIWALDGQEPEIHPTAWIAPSAQVIGKVRIGARASVWFGAVLRGDNEWIEVGKETNIQENVVCHTDWGFPLTIGARCTIGHKAMLHGCSIGETTLIGMSATILNGAVIGPECLVGAGALVTEGKRFEARSLLMGVPARAVRELDAMAVAGLHRSAEGYAANAARFAAGLSAVTTGCR